MVPDPGVVGADRKRGDSGRILMQRREYIRHRAVTREQHAAAVLFQHIAVEAICASPWPSLAPMIRAHRGHRQAVHGCPLAPSQLAHIGISERPDETRASSAGDDNGAL